MTLFGLSAAQLWGIFAAAASLTVLLYMLKQRRHRIDVPFILLWESLLRDRPSSRLFARLKYFGSLLLALIIVALLTVALGDPRNESADASVHHSLVLIDSGITMQATDVAQSRLAQAKVDAKAVVQGAGAHHRMLVAQMDESATPRSSMTDDRQLLEDAVAQIDETELPTDSEQAYRFALDVLPGLSNPALVVISDSAADPLPTTAKALKDAGIALRFVRVGKRGDNAGISAFAVRRYPLDRNRSELLIEIFNASAHAEQATLTLLGDGEPIDVQQLHIEAGAQLRRVYDDVTGAAHTLEARLAIAGDHDDLARDDVAYAVLPERKRTRVLCVTDGNRYLEAALLLDEYLDVDIVSRSAYSTSKAHDVVVFDGHAPSEPPGIPALYIAPDSESSPLAMTGHMERPLFEQLHQKHPVLRFTALRDVNVSIATRVKPLAEDIVIAADRRGPLIVAGRRHDQPFVALTFDIRASDLPLRIAWPLLLLNTIDWFTTAAPDYVASGTVGETSFLSVAPADSEVTVRGPQGEVQRLPARDGTLALTPVHAGFYRITAGDGEHVIAANLSPKTRRSLTPARQPHAPPRDTTASSSSILGFWRPPFVALLLIAWLVILGEWLSYHRRWTL